MNREIKFRGWFQGINGQEYWAYGYLVKQINGNWEVTNGETSWTVDNVGQFTGLKDKNGKDIYEGDVIKHNENIYSVKFQEERCAVYGMYFSDIKRPSNWRDMVWGKNIEKYLQIIGNIHENPELLNKVTNNK